MKKLALAFASVALLAKLAHCSSELHGLCSHCAQQVLESASRDVALPVAERCEAALERLPQRVVIGRANHVANGIGVGNGKGADLS